MTEERNLMLRRFARDKNLTKSHHRSRKQEKELARRLGGVVTPASGARDVKGDVRVRNVLRLEAKTTKHKSFSVTLEMIRKIEEAAKLGEMPAIVVEFIDERGKVLGEVAVLPTYALDLICN